MEEEEEEEEEKYWAGAMLENHINRRNCASHTASTPSKLPRASPAHPTPNIKAKLSWPGPIS